MAENETETLDSPSDTEENHLPSTQVTETHDIVTPHSDASLSLEAAFEERAKKRTEEQAAAADEPETKDPAPVKTEAKEPEKTEEPEETDPRKRIKKQIEDAEKEAAEEKAEAEKQEDAPAEPSIEELTKLPEESKDWKKKTQERFIDMSRRIKSQAEKEAAIQKERDAIRAELEAERAKAKQSTAPNEDVQKQLDELAMFRRQYQLENSPEIKAQFDAIVEQGEKFIGETLKGYGIAEATVKMIEGEGGFAAFSRSQKTAMVDGEAKTYAEIAKDWLNGMNVADAEAIRAKLGEQRNTQDAKKRFIDAEKGKAKEYFTTQSEQYQSSVKAQQEAAQKQRELMENFYKKATTETDWMKEKEIPADASPEKKKEIEAENRAARDYQKILHATLNVQTIDELLAAALDSVAYHKTRLDLARANKRIKELEAKESKRKAASATTVKQGSIASPPTPKTRKQENNSLDAADAFELALERKARGEE